MTIVGRIVNNKKQAQGVISLLMSRFDGTLEASVAIQDVEEIFVKKGFLTWEEVEEAEVM